MTDQIRIDAHHHLWDLTVRDQEWTVDFPGIRRSFFLDDLRPELVRNAVDGTVLVQTITVAAETPELLALAACTPEVLGVVGWVDLTAPDVADAIARLKGLPGGDLLVGVRHQVQSEPDPEWLLRDDVGRGLRAVADAGLVYDILVTHHQLAAAVKAVDTVPGLRWVLDHAGKPAIGGGLMDPWRDQLTALAAHEAVSCKLSGLVTEAGEDWSADRLRPYAHHVIDRFGADRVMFGSDWPVCLLRSSYDEVVELAEDALADLNADERRAVWGGTAARWYGLSRPDAAKDGPVRPAGQGTRTPDPRETPRVGP